jgi:hypothetical protein
MKHHLVGVDIMTRGARPRKSSLDEEEFHGSSHIKAEDPEATRSRATTVGMNSGLGGS